MASKQPLYTAVGFVTWQVGKRALKRKLHVTKERRRGRKVLLALIVLGGAGAGAYAVTSSSGSSSGG